MRKAIIQMDVNKLKKINVTNHTYKNWNDLINSR